MMLYAQSPDCRWKFLLDYFGADEDLSGFRCGTCDNCRRPVEWEIAPPSAELFPRPPESPLPPPDRRRTSRLRPGQRVSVAEYGEGEIRALDGDKVEVAFADGELRKFKREFLTKEG